MPKYEFTVVLDEPGDLSEELADRLFAVGCDDGTPGQSGGVVSVDFHREAESLETAIRSAVLDVRSAGCRVDRVELEPEAVAASS